MKALLSFLLLFVPFGQMIPVTPEPLPIACSREEYRWYIKRNSEHLPPELPGEFSFLSECDAWYCDTRESAEKTLYLTFDAGYENGNIAKILDVLKEESVPAAFFVLEHLVTDDTALIKRMLGEGHLVCNHTARHKNLARASEQAVSEELGRMERVYRETMGCEISKYYRPPEGAFSESNLLAAKNLGYKTVFWSFAYADWANDKQPSPEFALKKIRDNIHPGAVLLLHPTSATNAAIMKELIVGLKAEGYRFGTLDELTSDRV